MLTLLSWPCRVAGVDGVTSRDARPVISDGRVSPTISTVVFSVPFRHPYIRWDPLFPFPCFNLSANSDMRSLECAQTLHCLASRQHISASGMSNHQTCEDHMATMAPPRLDVYHRKINITVIFHLDTSDSTCTQHFANRVDPMQQCRSPFFAFDASSPLGPLARLGWHHTVPSVRFSLLDMLQEMPPH